MWHTKEIAQIFINILNEYGYSVYSDKRKCIALCGDLLVRFESEKNTLKMLFNEGVGEVLLGAPYKSNEELNMGLFRIKKCLWKMCCITK